MTQDTNPRFEGLSVEWVDAMREFCDVYFADKTVIELPIGGELAFPPITFMRSFGYKGCPAHLSRGDVQGSTGYSIRLKDGNVVEVLDHPIYDEAERDAHLIMDYEVFAPTLRYTFEEDFAFAANVDQMLADGKLAYTPSAEVWAPFTPWIVGLRLGFLPNYTA